MGTIAMALRWTEAAIVDLEYIRRYVTAVDRAAARRLADRIVAVTAGIERGAATDGGTIVERRIVEPFVIRYRTGHRPVVMAVRHGAGGVIV